MKHRLLAILLCLPMFTGCAFKKLFTGEGVDPEVIQFVADRAGAAALIGVSMDLKSHPERQPIYAAAVIGLDGLLQREDYTSADFQAVLAALPIKEFQGDTGALVVQGTVMVFDLVTLFAYDVDSAPALKAVMTSVRNGIKAAVDAKPATAKAIQDQPDKKRKELIPTHTRRI